MPANPTHCFRCGAITADLIDGPLADILSGLFSANCAWLACTVIAHNLLRVAGTLAGGEHLPAHWPSQIGWKALWNNIIGYSPAIPRGG